MRLRVGVIGGGLIAQAIHLPLLSTMSDRFLPVAVADPSATVVDVLASRYRIAGHRDWLALLDDPGLDAVLVCSPNHTHAEIVLEALARGLHVFVEKPLCLDPADAERIEVGAAEAGRVVQVGYMKRFDPAFESLLDSLPPDAEALRFIDVVTHDPGMAREPFVPWSRMVAGSDVPADVVEAGRISEQRQVASALGIDDPAVVRPYVDTYLGALIHDVNLVHGALERLAVPLPARPVAAASWHDADAGSVTMELDGGARWNCTWLLLPDVPEFRERVAFYFADAVHRLSFDAPYWVDVATEYEVTTSQRGTACTDRRRRVRNAYRAELEHFHECVTADIACRTPPSQAGVDVAALRDLFVRSQQTLDLKVIQ